MELNCVAIIRKIHELINRGDFKQEKEVRSKIFLF